MNGVHTVVKTAKNHFTGGGLQNAGHGNIDGPRDHLLGVVHHHHGSVVQIRDTLVVLLAFFQNKDAHGLAGEYHGLQRVGQFINVQYLHAVELRHLVEVEIVGDDLTVIDLGQLDQLHVYFRHVGKIVFQDLHVQLRHFLDALQDVQPAPAAIALERIRGVGHQLQFAQNELRDHQRAVQEARFQRCRRCGRR